MGKNLKYALMIFATVVSAACTNVPCVDEPRHDSEDNAYVFVKIGGSETTKALYARNDVYIGNVAMALYDSQTGAVVAHTGQVGNTSANSLYTDFWSRGRFYEASEIPELALRIDDTVLENHSRFRLAVVVNMHSGNYGASMYDISKNTGFFGGVNYTNFSQLKTHMLSTFAVVDNFSKSTSLLEDLTPICSTEVDGIVLQPGMNFVGYSDREIGAMSLTRINTMLGLSGDGLMTTQLDKHNLDNAISIENDRFYVQPVFSRVQIDDIIYDHKHFYLENAFILNGKHAARLFDDCMVTESGKNSSHLTSFRHAYVQSGAAATGSGWITDLYNWINGDEAPATDFNRLNPTNLPSTDGIAALDSFTAANVQPGGTTSPTDPNNSAYRTDMTHVHKHIVNLSAANSYSDFSAYIASLVPSIYGTGNYSPSSKYPYHAPLTRADGVSRPITSAQRTAYFKLPFFYVYPNDGSDETSVDEDGDRNYDYATYLVVRGYWKDDDTDWSTSENVRKTQGHIVYYPVLVNGNQKGLAIDWGSTPASERGTLIRRNRLYRLSLRITAEGVRNPWARSSYTEKNSVKIGLTVDYDWLNGGEQNIVLK